jgi:membrane protein implicated in regulation of membrane protease activity
MGLNVFCLFIIGFGLGSLAFGQLLSFGFNLALISFSVVQLLLAVLGVPLFAAESRPQFGIGRDSG